MNTKKRIVIVGLKGVGMAHLTAAGRLGYEVVALVDNDEHILEHAKQEWRNEWLDVDESTPVQPGTYYCTDVRQLVELRSDLLVLCTPPHTHVDILRKLPVFCTEHVICEKPLLYPDTPSPVNPCTVPVTISAEWAYHTELYELEKREGIQSMEMCYPTSRKTDWGYVLPDVFDFTPHFFSILEGFGRTVLDMHSLGSGEFVVHTDKGDCIFKEGSRNEPYGFFVNNTVFHWQDDLFDLQLAIGHGAVTWERMAFYDALLRRCLQHA